MRPNATNNLSIRIADVVIALGADDPDLRLGVEGPIRKFLVESARPDVSVSAAWADLSGVESLGQSLFNSASSWQLFRDNGRFTIRCAAHPSQPIPFKIASFNSEFTAGEVRLHRPSFSTAQAVYPLDYPLDELMMIHFLARGRGVVVHACGVEDVAGRGLLFVGQSGDGKTTTARLWLNHSRARVLSDDRIVIRKREGGLWMYGTPWHGEAEIAEAGRAPLDAIFFLRHGERNELVAQGIAGAVGRLFAAAFPAFHSSEALEFTLSFLEEVARSVPCHELRFVPNDSVIEFVTTAARSG